MQTEGVGIRLLLGPKQTIFEERRYTPTELQRIVETSVKVATFPPK